MDWEIALPLVQAWLVFLAAMAAAVAWPATVVIVALVFHSPLSRLLDRIKRVKWGDREAELSEGLERVEAVLEPLAADAKGAVQLEEAKVEATASGISKVEGHADAGRFLSKKVELIGLAAVDPRTSILFAWRWVEEEYEALVEQRGAKILDDQPTYVPHGTDMKLTTGVLRRMYDELRRLRNGVLHDPDFKPSTENSLRYVETAADLIEVFRLLRASTPRSAPAGAAASSNFAPEH